MASARSPITPADTSKPKIRRMPLTPKNIPAGNINNLHSDRETDCKWITITVAGTADKENRHVGRITGSSRKDLQIRKCVDASPVGVADRLCLDDKWISIPLAADTEMGQNVEPEKVKFMVKNDMDASLAEELEMIRQRNERLQVEKAKTEAMLAARDRTMKMMEDELELRWKAQERLEMELEKLLRLKELKTCLLSFQPVVALRGKHQSKTETEGPLQVKLKSGENRVAIEASGDMTTTDKIL